MTTSKKKTWKKGGGKLGVFEPLIGSWQAESDSPMGRVLCTRKFSRILAGTCVLLQAKWHLPGKIYEEHAIYAADGAGGVSFWSFTSDGKRSQGVLTAALDIHSESIAFEAQMPAGLARMAYWPDENGGINWAVESKTKNGWNRFTHHHYTATP